MKLIIVNNYHELSLKAADLVTQALKNNPRLVLGLATGSTPEGMYSELVSRYKKGLIDFAQVVTFNVDEYLGLPPAHRHLIRLLPSDRLGSPSDTGRYLRHPIHVIK